MSEHSTQVIPRQLIDRKLYYTAPTQFSNAVCFGTCPSGTMTTTERITPGFLTIEYHIPAALQKSYHPHPNRFHGRTRRIAYIPDTEEGRALLLRFQYAFLHGICFGVGRSLTSGLDDQVIWSHVLPHKTRITGGPTVFGFPDPDYLRRASHALNQLGVPTDQDFMVRFVLHSQQSLAGTTMVQAETFYYDHNCLLKNGDDGDEYAQYFEPEIAGYDTRDTNHHTDKECVICFEEMKPSCCQESTDVVFLKKCKHRFHKSCIINLFQHNHTKCPFCRQLILDAPKGLSPSGTLTISLDTTTRCPGFEFNSTGVIRLYYKIPGGVQTTFMENPGECYSGTTRLAFLPHNANGVALLQRLKFAFRHGMTFRVGTSLTTGRTNQVTWTSIHHKTSLRRDHAHGYPDPCYFLNCNDALDALQVPKAEDCA